MESELPTKNVNLLNTIKKVSKLKHILNTSSEVY